MYTVKQLSDMAGISVRTIHYYHEIGLLIPSSVADNGYRHYDQAALFRLQQIMFYREMNLSLKLIRHILDNERFDLISALQLHRHRLNDEIERLTNLIHTVDTTLMHLKGEIEMSNDNLFEGFSPEKQKQYEEEAIDQWGSTAKQSINLWNSYSEQKRTEILQEGKQIYQDIIVNMKYGTQSMEIRSILSRWHQHIYYFFEPSLEVLRGLGEMYYDHSDFNASFSAMHPDLPIFLKQAIVNYVDWLEYQQ